jgi:NDP-4-keto-2,6-dideoxyhexose 3-C-methyltransferase
MRLKISSHTQCRICGASLVTILDLGDHALSGIFPIPGDPEHRAPLVLARCTECLLVQLVDTVDPYVMFNEYGYRSGMNQTMTLHLRGIAQEIQKEVVLAPGDIVLDIGANDGTLLGSYPIEKQLVKIGFEPAKIDPIYKYIMIKDFFSAEKFLATTHGKKAKAVSAIAMFYDLEDPIKFCRDVAQILDDEGIFVIEVLYLPAMLDNVAFDAVCHEHLMYYTVKTLRQVLSRGGFSIRKVSFNTSNGGSVRVVADFTPRRFWVTEQAESDERRRITEATLATFANNAHLAIDLFQTMLNDLRGQNYKVFGYGASTKGNVLLQAAKIDASYITAIADRNPLKWGRVTPGTHIPIWSERKVRWHDPNVLVIFPWAFVHEFVKREAEMIKNGTAILVPLPKPHYLTTDDFRE